MNASRKFFSFLFGDGIFFMKIASFFEGMEILWCGEVDLFLQNTNKFDKNFIMGGYRPPP